MRQGFLLKTKIEKESHKERIGIHAVAGQADTIYPIKSWTTFPATLVRRKSRPA
jgi:hypothetical protein